MNSENMKSRTQEMKFRPKLTFYHPNSKCTGCAMQLELHPAHDDHQGSIMIKLANQVTVADRQAASPSFHRFDWENGMVIKLDFNDLSKMLQVFRGEREAIDDGRGLYHRTAKATTKIVLRHMIEPINGYSFEVYRMMSGNGKEQRAHMVFSASEGLGLCEAIAGSMSVISFGIPMVLTRGTKAGEEGKGGAYDLAE